MKASVTKQFRLSNERLYSLFPSLHHSKRASLASDKRAHFHFTNLFPAAFIFYPRQPLSSHFSFPSESSCSRVLSPRSGAQNWARCPRAATSLVWEVRGKKRQLHFLLLWYSSFTFWLMNNIHCYYHVIHSTFFRSLGVLISGATDSQFAMNNLKRSNIPFQPRKNYSLTRHFSRAFTPKSFKEPPSLIAPCLFFPQSLQCCCFLPRSHLFQL